MDDPSAVATVYVVLLAVWWGVEMARRFSAREPRRERDEYRKLYERSVK